MNTIIQFPHPGGEHNGNTGTDWNSGEHKRKFLKGNGSYLRELSTNPIEDAVYFWGEWEAPSTSTSITGNTSPLPKNIFEPYYTLPVPKNAANTDPFVFGNQFYYCVCKQGHYPSLRNLEKGDMILFGSNKNDNFILDTLFIVKDWVEYEKKNITDFKAKCNDVFYNVSLEPMIQTQDVDGKETIEDRENTGICNPKCGDDKTDNNFVKDIKKYRIYSALMFEDKDANGIFSYVPCLPHPLGKKGFERPTIYCKHLSQKLNQGIKIIKGEDINKIWHEITTEILNKRLNLMIKTDLPQLNNNIKKLPL